MKIAWPFSRGGAALTEKPAPMRAASTDRYLGCLLGGAVGDALGSPVEFMSLDAIRGLHGPAGVTTFYALRDAAPGSITDDTQMSLFMAEGILSAWARKAPVQQETALACLYWLKTQSVALSPEVDRLVRQRSSRVAQEPGIDFRRAPGKTCLDSLWEMDHLVDRAVNESKGCGSVMRMAPLGLYASSLQLTATTTFGLAGDCAATTHGHPTGQLAASLFALLVQRLVRGVPLPDALAEAKALLVTHDRHHECLYAIEKAEHLALHRTMSDLDAVHRIGEGWVAEEALAVAIYCALVAKDFRQGVLLAVNHNGDSDSLGAIAGNLLGAIHGATSIPPEWANQVEMRELIFAVAQDLYMVGHNADESMRPTLRARWLPDAPIAFEASAPGVLERL